MTTVSDFCQFGVEGLDHILVNGLPRNRLYMLRGAPGLGKTTLALQFLLEGVRQGEPTFYIALAETKEELQQTARSHGWTLDGIEILELAAVEKELSTLAQDTLFRPSELDLNRAAEFLIREIQRVKPARLVLDSLAEFRLMAETALRYRRQMLALKQFFSTQKITVLLLDDAEERDLQVLSVAHGVISLEMIPFEYGIERRRIKVAKLRGLNFRAGFHDFIIRPGGLQVFPRLVAAEHHREYDQAPMSCGIAGLDALLGGGFDPGTSNLIVGPAGTGKSSIAMQLAACAAKGGTKSYYCTFDENLKVLRRRADSLGMDLGRYVQEEKIVLRQIDPIAVTPGEFADEIVKIVEGSGVRVVVIDSLNGYMNSMPNERTLSMQLHELLTFLGQQGVVTIMTLAQQGVMGPMTSPVDLTYLADTVVLLRFFEAAGRVKKAMSVTKKRSGQHEDTIREYQFTKSGIAVGEPLTEFQGVLTGVPRFTGEFGKMLRTDESPRRGI